MRRGHDENTMELKLKRHLLVRPCKGTYYER